MAKLTRRTALGALAGSLAMPAVARAQTLRWRMATSWPRNLPGPGISAMRLTERIRAMSGGRLEIEVFPAGTLAPAFEVLDAVAGGGVEMGHTAAFYWRGKMPASVFYTTVPFGLGPVDHLAWLEFGDGQALWDELYRPFGVRGFAAGNTGPCMGGWFRNEIRSVGDIKGLRIRVLGIGGDVFSRLGATPVSMPAAAHGADALRQPLRRDARARKIPRPGGRHAPLRGLGARDRGHCQRTRERAERRASCQLCHIDLLKPSARPRENDAPGRGPCRSSIAPTRRSPRSRIPSPR